MTLKQLCHIIYLSIYCGNKSPKLIFPIYKINCFKIPKYYYSDCRKHILYMKSCRLTIILSEKFNRIPMKNENIFK